MILEIIAAAAIYTGTIAYLASDNPVQTTAPSNQSRVEMKAFLASSDFNPPTGLRSFTADASGRIRYADKFPPKHQSIWAKEGGKFEDWAK